jgi:hypothetical protein
MSSAWSKYLTEYNNTQQIIERALLNRHRGAPLDQIQALVAHIERIDRKQRNAVLRGDYQQACKHERIIHDARIRIVDLANPR